MIYLYYSPAFETKAWTVSPGEAHPGTFAAKLARLQARLGITDVPIAAGPETPTTGTNAFPDAWRASSDAFWGLPLPDGGPAVDGRSAAQVMVDVVKASPEPVVIVETGPQTNLAQAFALDPSIKDSIKLVEVMGGAIKVPGNIRDGVPQSPNTTAEWNAFVDPAAAEAVFTSGIPIRLMPLDTTNKVVFTSDQVKRLRASKNPGAGVIADILEWELKSFNPSGVNAWDLATAVDLAHPELTKVDPVHIEVITDQGPNQGQTLATSAAPASVSVCSQPDTNGFRNRLVQEF
jgi:inosine-uridine nucleoside N-ribohydrolase